jgi:hypothetical protein
MVARLQIEGVRELNRLLRAAGGPVLQKELGKVHKQIGQMVIDRLGGPNTGIGAGAGATIRPSAATREVLLRVGGAHRASWGQGSEKGKVGRWGKKWNRQERGKRPHLIGAAFDIEPQITKTYLDGVDRILRTVGAS